MGDLIRRRHSIKLHRTEETKLLEDEIPYSVKQIEDALRAHYGNLTYTAKFLSVSRELLEKRINSLPHMKRLLINLREEIIDEAEFQLIKQVQQGYFPAVSMLLKTLGKGRGYSERSEVDLGDNAVSTAAALIEAMRKGAESPEIVDVEGVEWEVAEEEAS